MHPRGWFGRNFGISWNMDVYGHFNTLVSFDWQLNLHTFIHFYRRPCKGSDPVMKPCSCSGCQRRLVPAHSPRMSKISFHLLLLPSFRSISLRLGPIISQDLPGSPLRPLHPLAMTQSDLGLATWQLKVPLQLWSVSAQIFLQSFMFAPCLHPAVQLKHAEALHGQHPLFIYTYGLLWDLYIVWKGKYQKSNMSDTCWHAEFVKEQLCCGGGDTFICPFH